MGSSKRTSKIRLPMFTDDDKPSFLGDWNETMTLIEREFSRLEGVIADQQTQINTLQKVVTK